MHDTGVSGEQSRWLRCFWCERGSLLPERSRAAGERPGSGGNAASRRHHLCLAAHSPEILVWRVFPACRNGIEAPLLGPIEAEPSGGHLVRKQHAAAALLELQAGQHVPYFPYRPVGCVEGSRRHSTELLRRAARPRAEREGLADFGGKGRSAWSGNRGQMAEVGSHCAKDGGRGGGARRRSPPSLYVSPSAYLTPALALGAHPASPPAPRRRDSSTAPQVHSTAKPLLHRRRKRGGVPADDRCGAPLDLFAAVGRPGTRAAPDASRVKCGEATGGRGP